MQQTNEFGTEEMIGTGGSILMNGNPIVRLKK